MTDRPPSPWTGSHHQARHRWQLDGVGTLSAASAVLRDLAAELRTAADAGWWLVEPMRSGHLLAERASRRQRAVSPVEVTADEPFPWPRRWRLRVVHEAATEAEPPLELAAVPSSSVLTWTGGTLEPYSGPMLTPEVLAEMLRQVQPTGLDVSRWVVAPARLGPSCDLVAEGSALRQHAVRGGALVRTHEALAFQHAADGARTLSQAAQAYDRIASVADAMAGVGGRLLSADDGFLQVGYAS